MKRNSFTNFFKSAMDLANEKSPAILTGLAVVGIIATAYQAYKAAPKCEKILAEKREKMKDIPKTKKEERREVTLETVKEVVPVMAPTVVLGAATIGCAIGSTAVSARRVAILSAAYNVAETAVKDLSGKMEEVLGEKKAKEIKSKVMQDKMKEHPLTDESKVVVTGTGDVLCYDSYSETYFYSSANHIAKAINKLSHRIRSEMYISLNEFYDELGGGLKAKRYGRDIGWNVDDVGADGTLPITWGAVLDEYDRPVLCVQYHIEPRKLRRSFGDR